MREGDVVLTPLPQADGAIKNRPALLLRQLPPFGDLLACGISTRIDQAVVGFDEVIHDTDRHFVGSGLRATSVIRLGFLALLPRSRIAGSIGVITPELHRRLLIRLSQHLVAELSDRA